MKNAVLRTFKLPLKFATVALTSLTLVACGGGKIQKTLDLAAAIQVSSQSVVSYNTTTATLNLRGKMTGLTVTPLLQLKFFKTSTCKDDVLGTGTIAGFESSGIEITLPSAAPTDLFAQTNASTECLFVTRYTAQMPVPQPPAFSSTAPSSPSASSTTPAVYGTTTGSITKVRIFTDLACSVKVGEGTPTQFSTVGIGTTVAVNQTTSLYGQTEEPFGQLSTCFKLVDFIHDSVVAPSPVLTSMTPPSPSSASTTPLFTGTLDASIDTIKLYKDSACLIQVASGAAADFTSSGISVTVAANSKTLFYARATDHTNHVSTCTYLEQFISDTTPPAPPEFLSVSPGNPTRLTVYPQIKGTTSADTFAVKLYSDLACTVQIGTGSASDYVGTGLTASARGNQTTRVYGRDFDEAGNGSTCAMLVDFVNNTIPPDVPTFVSTTPTSPNNSSTTPKVAGFSSGSASLIRLYDDAICTHAIGNGAASGFISPGIQVAATANATTTIFATAEDSIGNVSACESLVNYMHSTNPAPAPVYARTSPVSPARGSTTPSVQGTSAATIIDLRMYSDNACTTLIGSGLKSDFEGSGVQVTAASNAQTSIYAKARDHFGNDSACTFMTFFTHDNLPPALPTYSTLSPASPNRDSTTPVIRGSVSGDTAMIKLYDDSVCSTQIASDTGVRFVSPGIEATVAQNRVSTIYAKAFDAAGNPTACTYMTDYTHDRLPPGQPILSSATPRTPSYTRKVYFKGTIGASADFLPISAVDLYTDAICSSPLVSGTQSQWTGAGLFVVMPANVLTQVYGQSTDIVGNKSPCNFEVAYLHNDSGPTNLAVSSGDNGTISLSWLPDSKADAYIVKRSTKAGGPYTIINPYNASASFSDPYVNNNTTYYYVIASTNITGISKDSSEGSAMVSIGAPPAPSGLAAAPSSGLVSLSWSQSSSAATYTLYRSTTSGGPYTAIFTGASGSLGDSNVTNGTIYYYVVRAANTSGASGYSAEVSAMPRAIPPPPTNLQGRYTGSKYTLTWSAPSYYTSFRIMHGRTGASFALDGTVSGNTFSYTDNNPYTTGSDNLNFYSVRAVYGSAESVDSNIVSFSYLPGTNLVTRAGHSEVYLSWTSISNAVDYVVMRSTVPGGPYQTIVASTTNNVYTDTSVSDGTTYYYVVMHHLSGNVDGIQSAEVDATPGAAITAGPTNLIVSNAATNFPQLNWSAPSKYNSFNVYRSTSSGGPFTKVSSTSVYSTSYLDNAAPLGTSYYRITADWGTTESTPSNVVSYRNGTTATLNAVSTTTQITLNWTAVTGASSYRLLRAPKSGGTYALVNSNVTSPYVDSSAVADTGYFYRLQADFADATTGQLSNEVSGQFGTSKVPAGVSTTAVASTSVSLAWSGVPSATTYKVYTSVTSGGAKTLRSSGAVKTLTLSSLASSTNYFVTVTAVVGGIESGSSAELVVRTLIPYVAPQVKVGSNLNELTWGAVFAVDSFDIERSSDYVNFTKIGNTTALTYTDSTATNGNLYFYRYRPVFAAVPNLPASPVSQGATPGIVPVAPGNLVVTQNSVGTEVALTWGSILGATQYQIKQATSAAGPYTSVGYVTGTVDNLITGLNSGTAYYFKVSSLRGYIESPDSAFVAVTPLTQPSSPTVMIVNNTTVSVTWPAKNCGGSNAVSYTVLRSTNDWDYATLATGVTGLSYSDTSFTNGISYSYQIQAFCTAGVPASVSPRSSPHVTPGVAPLAPSGLIVYSLNNTSAVLSWVTVPVAATYKVYRSNVSGGPYTYQLTSSVGNATQTGLSAGSYFYVVTSVDPTGIESVYSSETGLTLSLTAPTTVTATGQIKAVSLAWSTVAGASSYSVYRGVSTGGPYGLVTTLAGTTFTDSTGTPGQTYYYVVSSRSGASLPSPYSVEKAATPVPALSLQVPIELLDSPVGSLPFAQIYDRSRTSLDTNAYDGSPVYEFEVVAMNHSSSSYTIDLVNDGGTVAASATIPASTNVSRRVRASFTPTNGKATYRVRTPSTSSALDVEVQTARMLVTQTNATKTKIYIPLLSSAMPSSPSDTSNPISNVNASVYASIFAATPYKRETVNFAHMADYNPWELETVVASVDGARGAFGLIDATTNNLIQETETIFDQSSLTLVKVPFSDGVTFFDGSTQSHLYEIGVRCYDGCDVGSASLYKAGLWVTLDNLTKAQVYLRMAQAAEGLSTLTSVGSARALYDASKFTNPSVQMQVVGAANSGTTTYQLSMGSADQGTVGMNGISGSEINNSATSKRLQRSTTTPNALDRAVVVVDPGTGSVRLNSAFLLIQAQ